MNLQLLKDIVTLQEKIVKGAKERQIKYDFAVWLLRQLSNLMEGELENSNSSFKRICQSIKR